MDAWVNGWIGDDDGWLDGQPDGRTDDGWWRDRWVDDRQMNGQMYGWIMYGWWKDGMDKWMRDYPSELGFESTWALQTLGFIWPWEIDYRKQRDSLLWKNKNKYFFIKRNYAGEEEMKVGKICRYFQNKIKNCILVPSNIKLRYKSNCSMRKKEMPLEKSFSSLDHNISEIP